MTTTTQTVGEIALDQPSSIRVFEQFGIDPYCCWSVASLSQKRQLYRRKPGNRRRDCSTLEAADREPQEKTANWTEKVS